MGWRKTLSHSVGGDIALGNWRAHFNKLEDSIDILHPSNGIPYIKTDTTFTGVLKEMVVLNGKLQIIQYPGWSEAITASEDFVCGTEATVIGDENDSASLLVDALFGSTATTMFFEGDTYFESAAIALALVGKYHSSKAEWVLEAAPVGTTTKVYSAAQSNGGPWGSWAQIVASANPIGVLPTTDSDLTRYKIKYKVVMTPTADNLASPTLTELKTTINSQKHIRIMADGVYKESQHIIDSVAGATIELLS